MLFPFSLSSLLIISILYLSNSNSLKTSRYWCTCPRLLTANCPSRMPSCSSQWSPLGRCSKPSDQILPAAQLRASHPLQTCDHHSSSLNSSASGHTIQLPCSNDFGLFKLHSPFSRSAFITGNFYYCTK